MSAAVKSEPAGAILAVSDLTVRIGGLTALDRMNLAVERGRIVSLIGPNGAGKTTAFNVITGYMRPNEGRILFEGEDLVGLAPDRIASRGVVRTFQRTSIFGGCTVFDNILTALHRRGDTGLLAAVLRLPVLRREDARLRADADAILDFVGLTARAGTNADDLAYGEQRLLGLAIALGARPSLLLLDEPAAGLNPSETEHFKELVKRTAETGTTVLLVEHDMQMVMSISDTVFVLNQGRMIASGPPAAIQNDPEVIRAYLGAGPAHARA